MKFILSGQKMLQILFVWPSNISYCYECIEKEFAMRKNCEVELRRAYLLWNMQVDIF